MKKVLPYFLLFYLGLFTSCIFVVHTFDAHAGGKSHYSPPPVVKTHVPNQPAPPPPSPGMPTRPVVVPVVVPPAISPGPSTNIVTGGGWNGGCSTYADDWPAPWGKVPCVPTNPSQGPAVTPESLAHPVVTPPHPAKNDDCSGPHPTCIKLSAMPYTGYSPTLFEYILDLLSMFI